ncbi:MAG: hypothetical protein FWF38_00505 [Spirochaetaceae bacterium]|nr:hypothetical protein [Spirochaetaceae bacterium]
MKFLVKETFCTDKRYLEGAIIDIDEKELEALRVTGQGRRLLTLEGKQVQTQDEYEDVLKKAPSTKPSLNREELDAEIKSLTEAKTACLKKIAECEEALRAPELKKEAKEKLKTAVRENAKEVAAIEKMIKELSKQIKG